MRFGVTWKNGREVVSGFSEAVISSLMSLAGFVILGRMVWATPNLHSWGWLAIAIGVLLVVTMLLRIYTVHRDTAARAADDADLRQVHNAMITAFLWGNGLVMLVTLAVFQVWLQR